MGNRKVPFRLFFPEARLGIEVDGPYHLSSEQKKIDKHKDHFCKLHAISLLRFTNDQIANDVGSVIEKIKDQLKIFIVPKKETAVNTFTKKDADLLIGKTDKFKKLLDGSLPTKNVNQEFFVNLVNSNLNSDTITARKNKSFDYVVSYLRWLNNNQPDLKIYIERHYLFKKISKKT